MNFPYRVDMSNHCLICGTQLQYILPMAKDGISEYWTIIRAARYEHDQEYHPLYYAEQMGII